MNTKTTTPVAPRALHCSAVMCGYVKRRMEHKRELCGERVWSYERANCIAFHVAVCLRWSKDWAKCMDVLMWAGHEYLDEELSLVTGIAYQLGKGNCWPF